MSYELSFSPEFFLQEGEPYDGPGRSDRPTSVWQAIESMDEKTWEDVARDVFAVHADHLTAETVLDKIRETNTCSNLNSPVEVWIDEAGDYRVKVYDVAR